MLYAADSAGTLHLDAGAAAAMERHSSLLAVGLTRVDGGFTSGEVLDIVGPDGVLIGRGEVNYDSATLEGMIGKSTNELPEFAQRPVVHVDYMATYSNRQSRVYGAT